MTAARGPANILVVDDDELTRTTLAMLLEELGDHVMTAGDGDAALACMYEQVFDLVITDLQMPRASGLDLLARVRATPIFQDVPIILVSGMDDPGVRASALDLGADDFVTKPVDVGELLARVRLHLRHATRSRELALRAVVDELTGVLNRRGIRDVIERELKRSARSGAELSVLMIDIDNFKAINDQRGHAAGDRTLQAVARGLSTEVRAGDRVGRYGGDEFVIVLPDTGQPAALWLAERLRRDERIGLSIGCATATPTDSVDELVGRADAAMYQNKRPARFGQRAASSSPSS